MPVEFSMPTQRGKSKEALKKEMGDKISLLVRDQAKRHDFFSKLRKLKEEQRA